MHTHDEILEIPQNTETATLPPHVTPGKHAVQLYNTWEKWNNKKIKKLMESDGSECLEDDTGVYLQDQKSIEILNQECKSALQLGIGYGRSINFLSNLSWKITGYDYSLTAINFLKSQKGMNIRTIDLNEIDGTGRQLAYHNKLREDLKATNNVIAINIFQYLEKPSLQLLLFCLLDLIKPESVLFITNTAFIGTNKKYHEITKRKTGVLEAKFITSFFAPRTDIAIIQDVKAREYPIGHKTRDDLEGCEVFEEKIILKKIF